MSAVPGRHASRGRRPRPRSPLRRAEADRAEIAAGLQQVRGGWLVLWSAWRQTYTGFACFTREPLIVDEAKIDRFLARLGEVERAYHAQAQ